MCTLKKHVQRVPLGKAAHPVVFCITDAIICGALPCARPFASLHDWSQ